MILSYLGPIMWTPPPPQKIFHLAMVESTCSSICENRIALLNDCTEFCILFNIVLATSEVHGMTI